MPNLLALFKQWHRKGISHFLKEKRFFLHVTTINETTAVYKVNLKIHKYYISFNDYSSQHYFNRLECMDIFKYKHCEYLQNVSKKNMK